MKNTLFFKTISGYIVISLFLVISISLFSYRIITNYHLDSLRDYLSDINHTLSLTLADLIEKGNYEQLDNLTKKIGSDADYRITVIGLDGEILADSEEDPKIMDNHRTREEIIPALQQAIGESIRFSDTLDSEMLYRAYPLYNIDNEFIGVLRISIFADQINELLFSLRASIFRISLLVMLISAGLIYLYIANITKPVRELTKAVKKVSEGEFNVKVINESKDDIGRLIRVFNDMTEYIRSLISELTYRKSSLDTIMTSMKEGLVLIDDEGIIKEANPSFISITSRKEVINHKYWEVIDHPELARFIRHLSQSRKDISKEIVINETYYLGSGLVTADGELLILMHNITELKNIEQIKKDIVANVSHELRSPLTAIKGFLETIETEVSDTGKEFLKITQRNVERLIHIVNDLLSLSRLERGDTLELQPVNLNSIVSHVAAAFDKKIKEKKLSLNIKTDKKLPIIPGDEFKLEQLLSNLIENALQYTDKGSISITTGVDDCRIFISVADTGCGIPENQIDKIFGRFHVADKSRSRKYGGTGLGLAIVKHIVLLHNGDIKVDSKLHEGSVFTVFFAAPSL